MATLTTLIKEELSRVEVTKPSTRRSEISTLLRFAGGVYVLSGCIVIQAEVELASTAVRLRAAIAELYGPRSEIIALSSGSPDARGRYIVRVVRGGAAVARQTGLMDGRGRPVRGLPPVVVGGSMSDAVGAWRGAFLAQGSLPDPRRYSTVVVTCPSPEAAFALVGTARRIGIYAKARQTGGIYRVTVRNPDDIAALLARMGAPAALAAWEKRRHIEKKASASFDRVDNFDDANQRRSTQAAVAVTARVSLAFEILGEDIPEQLKRAGELRLVHQEASLEELARLADPPVTKDTIAGRIRRLLVMADKHAAAIGIPGTGG